MNTPQLETERLLLRRFQESDIGALYQLNFDEKEEVFKKYWDNSAVHFIEKDK